MELKWIKFEGNEEALKRDAVYLVKCRDWNEAGMSVGVWDGNRYFVGDHPDYDRFTDCVTHFMLLEEQ